MRIESNGVFYWKTLAENDTRGNFTKIISDSQVEVLPEFNVLDFFSSISRANVIRGMHLQIGEFASNRIIYVQTGKIIDVLLDLNGNSKNPIILSEILGPNEEFDSIYVPAGIAHGFKAIQQSSVTYLADKKYSTAHDKGIKFDSFGFNWNCEKPIISIRDINLPKLVDFRI
ncbi:unannotated protein [freshwater metagenome]|uniref:Unannotated protein n=1 Tax=freshwater metagenome TaxID=449393 RepID=A0A6J6EEJ2_9ZZZZ|nr:dTDP-4-dehydrorhamnose 3,5-epimerase [Actinomycetota bacterium]